MAHLKNKLKLKKTAVKFTKPFITYFLNVTDVTDLWSFSYVDL